MFLTENSNFQMAIKTVHRSHLLKMLYFDNFYGESKSEVHFFGGPT